MRIALCDSMYWTARSSAAQGRSMSVDGVRGEPVARSQVAVSSQSVSKHALYIRLRKIVADKKQPTAALLRKGVGKAIAENQCGRVRAPPPAPIGLGDAACKFERH